MPSHASANGAAGKAEIGNDQRIGQRAVEGRVHNILTEGAALRWGAYAGETSALRPREGGWKADMTPQVIRGWTAELAEFRARMPYNIERSGREQKDSLRPITIFGEKLEPFLDSMDRLHQEADLANSNVIRTFARAVAGVSSQATLQSIVAYIQKGGMMDAEMAAGMLEAVAKVPWAPVNLLSGLAGLNSQTDWLAASPLSRRSQAILEIVPKAATETLSALERS